METGLIKQRRRAGQRVTTIGMVCNIFLSAGQITIGWLGHSQALIADGIHTLTDVVTDVLVFFGIIHGSRLADEDHPYGHARIETVFTVFLSLLLIIVGIGIAVRAGNYLASGEFSQPPDVLVLFMVIVTLITKEGLYRYTLTVGLETRSELLQANAWHHRSDAISSLVVLFGVAGTMMGIEYLDGVAAIGVALFVIRIGARLGWKGIRELIDTAAHPDQIQNYREFIAQSDGVRDTHELRTRYMAGRILVDVHIMVDDRISVSEGHYISESVRHRMKKKFPEIIDVLVHIDVEDDMTQMQSAGLPMRRDVLPLLRDALLPLGFVVEDRDVILHYLGDRLGIDIYCHQVDLSSGDMDRIGAATRSYLERSENLQPVLGLVRVYYCG